MYTVDADGTCISRSIMQAGQFHPCAGERSASFTSTLTEWSINPFCFFPADMDFVAFSYMLEIPAITEIITLRNVSILDDDIHEAEEVFIVIVRLLGVAESMACFQQQSGGECKGDTGAIIIRIRDDDRKLIPHSCLSLRERDENFPKLAHPHKTEYSNATTYHKLYTPLTKPSNHTE